MDAEPKLLFRIRLEIATSDFWCYADDWDYSLVRLKDFPFVSSLDRQKENLFFIFLVSDIDKKKKMW